MSPHDAVTPVDGLELAEDDIRAVDDEMLSEFDERWLDLFDGPFDRPTRRMRVAWPELESEQQLREVT